MAIEPINHYSLNTPASIYDEEALTALELAARTANKVNECIGKFNKLAEDTEKQVDEFGNITGPANIAKEVNKFVENGTFDDQIERHYGNIEKRVDNIAGAVTEGTTTLDTEVIDTRLDALGYVNPTAGEAVRNQFSTLFDMFIAGFNRELEDVTTESPLTAYINKKGELVTDFNYTCHTLSVNPGEVYYIDCYYGYDVPDAVVMSGDKLIRYYNAFNSNSKHNAMNMPIIIPNAEPDTAGGSAQLTLLVNNYATKKTRIAKVKGWYPQTEKLTDFIGNMLEPFQSLDMVTEPVKVNGEFGKVITVNGEVINTASNPNSYHLLTIPVKPGETYTFTAGTHYGNITHAIYDEVGTMIVRGKVVSGEAVEKYETTITIPVGASTLRVAGHNTAPAKINILTGYNLPEGSGSGSTGKTSNFPDWSHLTWVVIGDSVSEVNSTATKRYFDYIAEKTGINVVNLAVSGQGFCNDGAGDCDGNAGGYYYSQVPNIPDNADIITFMMSGNDNEFDSYMDSCVYNTIYATYTAHPRAKIGVITPIIWKGHQIGDDDDLMYQMIANGIERMNIFTFPILELHKICGINPNKPEHMELFYTRDNGAGQHPDENGHKRIAPLIYDFLYSMIGEFD